MTGLILVGVFLLSAGYAKLSTMVLNRIIAVTLPTWANKTLEIIQLLSMPAYAMILLISLYSPHAGFDGLNWKSITYGELALILAGLIGLGFLAYSTIVFQSYRPPRCEITCDSRIVDFRTTNPAITSDQVTAPDQGEGSRCFLVTNNSRWK